MFFIFFYKVNFSLLVRNKLPARINNRLPGIVQEE